MAHIRRKFSPFSLSFLDIMSCGFGAVVLLFLIMKHHVDATVTEPLDTPDLASEVNLLEEEILEGKLGLAKLKNSLAKLDEQIVIAEGLARRISDDVNETAGEIEVIATNEQISNIQQLKDALKQLEEDKQRLEAETTNTGGDVRSFVGEGNRQYLTGLKLGGWRMLVLLDTSASMLDKTIVNIIRRRNMSDEHKRNSEKWQQALETIDWLSAKFPITSQYQIYTFDTEVQAVLQDTKGQWLDVSNREQLNEVIEEMKKLLPAGGTNLGKAFAEIGRMRPLPDNVYLITDGLPTQGQKPPRSTTISGKDRLDLFEDALKNLPKGVPVNVILSPLEGDPMAASAFWQLAQITDGSFMCPTEDWP